MEYRRLGNTGLKVGVGCVGEMERGGGGRGPPTSLHNLAHWWPAELLAVCQHQASLKCTVCTCIEHPLQQVPPPRHVTPHHTRHGSAFLPPAQVSVLSFGAWVTFGTQVSRPQKKAHIIMSQTGPVHTGCVATHSVAHCSHLVLAGSALTCMQVPLKQVRPASSTWD